MNIKQLLTQSQTTANISGWVRTCRSSSDQLGFCNINDGSCPNGLQIIITPPNMDFLQNVTIGCYVKCWGEIVPSPAKGQEYEMKLESYIIIGDVDETYPLSKTRIGLDKLRQIPHLRSRTSTFSSVFRIRSKLMKSVHDFYHDKGFLHLDPNIITINECEGGAGVFQVTEHDISKIKNYNSKKDHFCRPAYLTVSSQLQLEAMACSLGNVYTTNKSFRSEHSSSSKHVSEFTHLEIEMINNSNEDLMDNGRDLIKYCINRILEECYEDLVILNKFVSKGIIKKLQSILQLPFKRLSYTDAIEMCNKNKKLPKMKLGDDFSSAHEDWITNKLSAPVFVYNWPISVKSFYMKRIDNTNGLCECFDLLMPFGIGELIGGSMREDNYDKLCEMMDKKGVDRDALSFYTDLRKYGSCPHGGFGLGFDRLLMLITGIKNIKDVIPFPVFYKNCPV